MTRFIPAMKQISIGGRLDIIDLEWSKEKVNETVRERIKRANSPNDNRKQE